MPDHDYSRQEAAEAVCRAIAARDDESTAILVNTFGFADFPEEVLAWKAQIGPHVFFPAGVLAAHATGRPIPERPADV